MKVQIHSNSRYFAVLSTVLRGIGQVMLQENVWTGLLFLLGLALGSPIFAIAAFYGALIGTFTAYAFRFPKAEIQQGLYGFSSALIGVAMLVFFEPSFAVWTSILVGAIASAWLQHFFIRKAIPVFTLPFVLITWFLLYLGKTLEWIAIAALPYETHNYDLFLFMFKGYGQVIFQDNLWVGILFFIGVFLNNRIAAFHGLIAAGLAGFVAFIFGVTSNDIALGLWSFNAVLTAIVFSGHRFKDFFWLNFSVILSLLFSALFFKLAIIQLTFPFVIASMLTLQIQKKVSLKPPRHE